MNLEKRVFFYIWVLACVCYPPKDRKKKITQNWKITYLTSAITQEFQNCRWTGNTTWMHFFLRILNFPLLLQFFLQSICTMIQTFICIIFPWKFDSSISRKKKEKLLFREILFFKGLFFFLFLQKCTMLSFVHR